MSRSHTTPKRFTIWFFSAVFSLILLPGVSAAPDDKEDAFDSLVSETIAFFKPLQGEITLADGKKIVVNKGSRDGVKPGMRFLALRRETPFRHPVTKELIGVLESPVGKLQIVETSQDSSIGTLIDGNAMTGDIARISEGAISLLFCQSRDVDWQIADRYYRKLKGTGRFQIVDTALETENPVEVLEEAKRRNVDVALHLQTQKTDMRTLLVQNLYWVSDGEVIATIEAPVDHARAASPGEKYFAFERTQSLIRFDVPHAARFLVMCDVDGDKKRELIFSNEKDLVAYAFDRDLQPALGGITVPGEANERHIWLDAIDLNRNGRDEIVITSLKSAYTGPDSESRATGESVVSSLYEYDGQRFVLVFRDSVFLRNIQGQLYAQSYSADEGFTGDIYRIVWDGKPRKGESLRLPAGVNLYDFVIFADRNAENLILAYDDRGALTVFDMNGSVRWRSKDGSGDFLTKFKKTSPSAMIDRGTWSVKDRLLMRQDDILSVKRIPLLEIVKGLGYRKSQIRSLRWNGGAMEERVLIDGIDGTLFDYAVSGDTLFVLASPVFGIKPGNILKGDNPVKRELIIYPMKGL